jgi:hypothetical protein
MRTKGLETIAAGRLAGRTSFYPADVLNRRGRGPMIAVGSPLLDKLGKEGKSGSPFLQTHHTQILER